MNHRDKSADGFIRRLRSFVVQRFEPLWRLVERIPPLAKAVNRILINTAVETTRNRPHAYSTVSDYASWQSLTDKTYFARHLPVGQQAPDLPTPDQVIALFRRPANGERRCLKSTLLFPVFAQYLTDGFLRTEMSDRRRTTSNHEIDMSPLYGRTREQTDVLRTRNEDPSLRGRLKVQTINGEHYPPFLFEPDGKTYKPEFVDSAGKLILDPPLGLKPETDGFQQQIFAVGGDRVNATPMVSMLNTLFLREHNRIAENLVVANKDWDDERVFQTARAILVVIYIKVVIEEYINHISSAYFSLRADPSVVWNANWNRPNWMTLEFALLYRWHSMIPEEIDWDTGKVPASAMLLNNTYLTNVGVSKALGLTSGQHACSLGIYNTPSFLEEVERRAIEQGRNNQMASYNSYREAMGLGRVTNFSQMTSDPARKQALQKLYGSPDRLDFYVGLFAEDVNANTPMPLLIGTMVALDAFSQALTNPLLSQHVFNAGTFTEWGMAEINKSQSIREIVSRQFDPQAPDVSPVKDIHMTRTDWKRTFDRF
ncbi:heme peroxidase [Rhizobium leguminosarum]|uniref:peroxidase family protein n=1 Tax=Rhizobium leguminosarum TaxID=384 RepID=UPI001C97E615|nr:peroxidase family protein [Rhizobium leguminosarum]MBY5721778.1 heme peroxidase [Rhizobium leguminosarum]